MSAIVLIILLVPCIAGLKNGAIPLLISLPMLPERPKFTVISDDANIALSIISFVASLSGLPSSSLSSTCMNSAILGNCSIRWFVRSILSNWLLKTPVLYLIPLEVSKNEAENPPPPLYSSIYDISSFFVGSNPKVTSFTAFGCAIKNLGVSVE